MKKIIRTGLLATLFLFLLAACHKKEDRVTLKKDLTGTWNFTFESTIFDRNESVPSLTDRYTGKIKFSDNNTFELTADLSYLNTDGEWFVFENKLYMLFYFNGSSGHYMVYNDNGIVLEQIKQYHSNPRQMVHNKFILTK